MVPGKLASVGSMLPGVGPIAASSAVLLNAIARLKITSVAPTNDYVWSVQKAAGTAGLLETRAPSLTGGKHWGQRTQDALSK